MLHTPHMYTAHIRHTARKLLYSAPRGISSRPLYLHARRYLSTVSPGRRGLFATVYGRRSSTAGMSDAARNINTARVFNTARNIKHRESFTYRGHILPRGIYHRGHILPRGINTARNVTHREGKTYTPHMYTAHCPWCTGITYGMLTESNRNVTESLRNVTE